MKIRNLLPAVRASRDQEADHPFYSLQREMNRMFDNFFRGFDAASPTPYESVWGGFSPSVDVRENDKEFTIKAELPGVDEKDVEVTVTNDSVTIRERRKKKRKTKTKITTAWNARMAHSIALSPWPRKWNQTRPRRVSKTASWKLKSRKIRCVNTKGKKYR